jgi:hypothetical protein
MTNIDKGIDSFEVSRKTPLYSLQHQFSLTFMNDFKVSGDKVNVAVFYNDMRASFWDAFTPLAYFDVRYDFSQFIPSLFPMNSIVGS